MLFLATHLGIALVTLFMVAVGSPLVRFLPPRTQPAARAYLTPALGLAICLLPVTFWGWFGNGFRSTFFRLLVLGIFLAALAWQSRSGLRWWRPVPRLLLLVSICALPFTFCLWSGGCFDPRNDAWTYLVQAQWLQHHAFARDVPTDSAFPAASQLYLTILSGTRAGAQFLLAAIQSALGLAWSHQAYPVLMGVAMGAGALTVGFGAALRWRHPRWLPGLGVLFAGAGLNGFSMGAIFGFLPQTVGLACATMTLWAGGATMAQLPRLDGTRQILRASVPVALGFAATLYAYGECIPLVALALAAAVAYALVCNPPGDRKSIVAWASAAAGLSLVLVAPELPRFAHAMKVQTGAVVGSAVDWPAVEFLLHALGFRPGNWETSTSWLGGTMVAAWVLMFLLLCAIALRARAQKTRRGARPADWLPIAGYLAISFALFIKFRYFTTNPFELGQGQSWNQFKLAGWSTLPALGWLIYLGAAPPQSRPDSRIGLRLLGGVLVVGTMAGLLQARLRAPERTAGMVQETGIVKQPLEGLRKFFAEAGSKMGPGAAVRLALDDPGNTMQKLAAYFMMDRPVLATWRKDGDVFPYFKKWADPAQMDAAEWLMTRDAWSLPGAVVSRGRFRLYATPELWLEPARVSGAYDQERSGEDWWHWIEQTVEFQLRTHLRNEQARSGAMKIRAQLASTIPDQVVAVTLLDASGQIAAQQTIRLAGEFTELRLPAVPLDRLRGTWTLRFQAEKPAVALGPNDARRGAFLVRNLRAELIPSGPAPADTPSK